MIAIQRIPTVGLLLAGLACGDARPTEPTLVEVFLENARIGLMEGASIQLEATVRRDGVAWSDAPVAWRSESPAVVSVDATGGITALAIGHARVFAEVGNAFAVIDVSVMSRCLVDAIRMIPAELRVRVNESAQATASVSCGSSHAPAFFWRSTDTLVARVDSAGRITGVAVGTALVTATLQSDATRSAATRVDVDP